VQAIFLSTLILNYTVFDTLLILNIALFDCCVKITILPFSCIDEKDVIYLIICFVKLLSKLVCIEI